MVDIENIADIDPITILVGGSNNPGTAIIPVMIPVPIIRILLNVCDVLPQDLNIHIEHLR